MHRHALAPMAVLLGLMMVTGALAGPNVFFGPPLDGEVGLEEHLLEFIAGAQTSLDCCLFDLKSEAVTAALVAKQKAGVKVRLVTDDGRYFDMFKGKIIPDQVRGTIQTLLDAGVPVVHDDRSPLMHNKFFIKDGRFVWTGSYNITEPGTKYNWNNSLWVESPEMAEIYTREMNEMIERREFGPDSTSDLDRQTCVADGIEYEVFFSPEDDPNGRILELVQNATEGVYFMHYAFTHAKIGDALVEQRMKGHAVEGIFDHLLYRSTGPTAQFAKLTAAGIPVAVARPHKGIQHNKLFIIDPNTDHGIVITGSLNISDSGGEQNDENTIIIHDSETARRYLANFERRKKELSPVVAEIVIPEAAVVDSIIPELDVHVVTNSQPIRTVSVEFAARWKIEDSIVDACKVFRGREDITDRVTRTFKSQRLTFVGVDLTAEGDGRALRIQLLGIPTPKKKAGVYNFYVKVGDGEDHDSLMAIAEQPTVEIFSKDDAATLDERVKALDAFLDDLLAKDTAATTKEAQVEVLRTYSEQFRGLETFLLGELSEGEYGRLWKLMMFAEKATNPDSLILRAAMAKIKSLRRLVLAESIHSENQDLLAVAELMQELCERYGVAAAPLAPVDTEAVPAEE